jgi:hypothetical protein
VRPFLQFCCAVLQCSALFCNGKRRTGMGLKNLSFGKAWAFKDLGRYIVKSGFGVFRTGVLI